MTNKEIYIKIMEIHDEALYKRPEAWRYGQAVFNFALNEFPTEVDKLRAGPKDCFYRDDRVSEFLITLQFNLQENVT